MNRFESLTDIQVRHGKIPTSVLQGPFLASVTKFICRGCRNAISANFRCNLKNKKTERETNLSKQHFHRFVDCSCAQRFGHRLRPNVTLLSGSLGQQRKANASTLPIDATVCAIKYKNWFNNYTLFIYFNQHTRCHFRIGCRLCCVA